MNGRSRSRAPTASRARSWSSPAWRTGCRVRSGCAGPRLGGAQEPGFGDAWGHCLVARGSADVMVELELATWDFAALQVIVDEAGGRMSQFDGSALARRNGRDHQRLPARRDRREAATRGPGADAAQGGRQTPHRRPRIGDGDLRLAVVPQGEPIARGLGRHPSTVVPVQVPVHPFVQVQEPEHLARRSERHAFGQPDEPDGPSGPALGAERDHLAEREERLGDLQRDGPRVEVGLRAR